MLCGIAFIGDDLAQREGWKKKLVQKRQGVRPSTPALISVMLESRASDKKKGRVGHMIELLALWCDVIRGGWLSGYASNPGLLLAVSTPTSVSQGSHHTS